MLGGQFGQSVDGDLAVADAQFSVGPRDRQVQVLLRPGLPGAGRPLTRQASQRLAPPQLQRSTQPLHPLVPGAIGRTTCVRYQPSHPVQIHRVWIDL
jgi:hypothetical protein